MSKLRKSRRKEIRAAVRKLASAAVDSIVLNENDISLNSPEEISYARDILIELASGLLPRAEPQELVDDGEAPGPLTHWQE